MDELTAPEADALWEQIAPQFDSAPSELSEPEDNWRWEKSRKVILNSLVEDRRGFPFIPLNMKMRLWLAMSAEAADGVLPSGTPRENRGNGIAMWNW